MRTAVPYAANHPAVTKLNSARVCGSPIRMPPSTGVQIDASGVRNAWHAARCIHNALIQTRPIRLRAGPLGVDVHDQDAIGIEPQRNA